MSGLRYPSHGRLRQSGHPGRPSAEGRSNWLNLLRKILSFSIPNRFYPGTLRPLSSSHFFFFSSSFLLQAAIPLTAFEVTKTVNESPQGVLKSLERIAMATLNASHQKETRRSSVVVTGRSCVRCRAMWQSAR